MQRPGNLRRSRGVWEAGWPGSGPGGKREAWRVGQHASGESPRLRRWGRRFRVPRDVGGGGSSVSESPPVRRPSLPGARGRPRLTHAEYPFLHGGLHHGSLQLLLGRQVPGDGPADLGRGLLLDGAQSGLGRRAGPATLSAGAGTSPLPTAGLPAFQPLPLGLQLAPPPRGPVGHSHGPRHVHFPVGLVALWPGGGLRKRTPSFAENRPSGALG